MPKVKNWGRTVKEVTGTKKILKVDFGSGSYIFTEKELLVSSSGEAEYKGQNTARFNVLNSLL